MLTLAALGAARPATGIVQPRHAPLCRNRP